MHGFENGVSAHRRLFPVMDGFGGGQFLPDEIFRMPADCFKSLFGNVLAVGFGEAKPTTEGATRQFLERLVCGHGR